MTSVTGVLARHRVAWGENLMQRRGRAI